MSERLPRTAVVVATAGASAVAAVTFPLLTYAGTLALFGLPHVLAELRYVDQRFGARLQGRMWVGLLLLLGAVVALRLAGLAGLGDAAGRGALELLLVTGMAAVVLPVLWRGGPVRLLLGAAVLAAIGSGAVRAPVATLAVLAILHNLTPVGFLLERLRGVERRRCLWLCGLLFGLVPLLLLAGLPGRMLDGLGGSTWAPFGWMPLRDHLPVFVPAFAGDAIALDLFRTAAYLQCLHYAAVLHVLPRLGPGDAGSGHFEWPAPRRFGALLTGAGAVAALGFVWSLRDARAVYGVLAAVHAWLEVPVLLLATTLPAAASWASTRSTSA